MEEGDLFKIISKIQNFIAFHDEIIDSPTDKVYFNERITEIIERCIKAYITNLEISSEDHSEEIINVEGNGLDLRENIEVYSEDSEELYYKLERRKKRLLKV